LLGIWLVAVGLASAACDSLVGVHDLSVEPSDESPDSAPPSGFDAGDTEKPDVAQPERSDADATVEDDGPALEPPDADAAIDEAATAPDARPLEDDGPMDVLVDAAEERAPEDAPAEAEPDEASPEASSVDDSSTPLTDDGSDTDDDDVGP
jgi:hypothetical protein